jgi:hypothetical protein
MNQDASDTQTQKVAFVETRAIVAAYQSYLDRHQVISHEMYVLNRKTTRHAFDQLTVMRSSGNRGGFLIRG